MSSNPEKSLIEYPCNFPIKVMGKNTLEFKDVIARVCKAFDEGFDKNAIEVRNSKENKYLGLTVTVRVHSREQLDEVYRTLSTHPLVSVVL